MDFYEWNIHRQKSVSQSDAGMCITRRIEDDVINRVIGSFLNGFDQRPFTVVLNMMQLMATGTRKSIQLFHDFIQTAMSVLVRLPAAQQIQIRTVDH